MNPCPCGYMGDPEKACTCPPHAIDRYRSRISGPILDRIDMYITVPRIRISEMNTPLNTSPSSTKSSTHSPINSITAREMVLSARKQQKQRFKDSTAFCNAEMSHTEIERIGKIHSDAKDIAIHSVERLKLSTRSYYRILRVARTIADLEGTEYIETPHILEALSYRIHS